MSNDPLNPHEPDTELDPYETLDVNSEATDAEIRSAYKKLALRNHPDKVAAADRDVAHRRFQQIAFAYGVLSDSKRRKRYDATGNTAESALDDEDFNWSDFFKARYTEITTQRILDFEKEYKHSDEERRDLLKAYKKVGGRMAMIYGQVMLSNPLDDEDRFQQILKDAIETGEIPSYDLFLKESDKSRQARLKQATKESKEATEHAKDLGIGGINGKRKRRYEGDVEVEGSASSDEDDEADEEPAQKKGRRSAKKAKAEPSGPKAKKATKSAPNPSSGGLGDLAAMIAQRQQSRSTTFLADLEAKYAPKSKGKKKVSMEEPPEEAFARTAARRTSKKAKS